MPENWQNTRPRPGSRRRIYLVQVFSLHLCPSRIRYLLSKSVFCISYVTYLSFFSITIIHSMFMVPECAYSNLQFESFELCRIQHDSLFNMILSSSTFPPIQLDTCQQTNTILLATCIVTFEQMAPWIHLQLSSLLAYFSLSLLMWIFWLQHFK